MFVLNEGATNFHSANKEKLIMLIPWITLFVFMNNVEIMSLFVSPRTKTSITMH